MNEIPKSSPNDRAHQKPVTVFTAQNELEAGMIQQLLSSCGIECVVRGRVAAGLYPYFVGDLGKREILVLEDDVEDARDLLSEWNSSRDEPVEDDGQDNGSDNG
ncbi:MAG: DUF2007 domain-containing protein [Acidobacteria bacterium]|nr:DUF2007 domain-containing protein [Acidobacteriota bacterium]